MVISFKFFLLSNKKDMKSKINTCIYYITETSLKS